MKEDNSLRKEEISIINEIIEINKNESLDKEEKEKRINEADYKIFSLKRMNYQCRLHPHFGTMWFLSEIDVAKMEIESIIADIGYFEGCIEYENNKLKELEKSFSAIYESLLQ